MVGNEVIKSKIIKLSPEEKRQMQLIQLEMLIEIDRICRKNKIHYRLVGGTLLGAVRHHGFIPWDADADVAMNRKDYELFYKACEKDLDTSRFFIQEWRTDPYYRWEYSRIRRKDTEFIRAGHEHMKYKTGIFVDILITDNVPDSPIIRPIHCFSCFAIRKILWSEVGKKVSPNWPLRMWYYVLSLIPRNLVFRLIHLISALSNRKVTKIRRNMGHAVSKHSSSRWGYEMEKHNYERAKYIESIGGDSRDYNEYMDGYVELEFEGYKFLAVESYEKNLRKTFGNYMELPPAEQQKSHIPCSKIKLIVPKIENFDELMKKQIKSV